jgi:hypothetical protein
LFWRGERDRIARVLAGKQIKTNGKGQFSTSILVLAEKKPEEQFFLGKLQFKQFLSFGERSVSFF